MKTYTLTFRQIDKNNFDELQSGIKSIETRAASPKYQSIKIGDTLTFICGNNKFSRVIKTKRHFKNLDSMFKVIPFKKIMPELDSIEEVKKIYYSYPNYKEKIKKFGILAFELK